MPYIGVSPQFGVRRKHTYTATASQTSFSGAGAEGATLSYTDSNFVDVYQNGVKLGDADYTSTSGTAIVLGTGATVNDIIEIIVFDAFSAADTVSKADGGTFDGNVTMGGTLTVTGAFTSQGIDDNADATAITIDSSEHVGIGTTSPDGTLHIHSASAGSVTALTDADDLVVENSGNGGISILTPDANRSAIFFGHASDNLKLQIRHDGGSSLSQFISDDAVTFNVGDGSERLRIDSSGLVGIGTSSPSSFNGGANNLVVGTGSGSEGISIFAANDSNSAIFFSDTDSTTTGQINYQHASNIFTFHTNGGNERMRIYSTGAMSLNITSNPVSSSGNVTGGHYFTANSYTAFSRNGGVVSYFNRTYSDGNVIAIRQDGTDEGFISVSGNTTSYGAFSGAHWSRLSDNSKPTILRGTIIETIDEMCDWYQVKFEVDGMTKKVSYALKDNEKVGDTITYTYEQDDVDDADYQATIIKEDDNKHTKCKISDTADSTRVYGVYTAWDDDDDTVNDMHVTACGTHIVRINKDVTVKAGDLLSSNGDGTAKVQDDDIIRSKTIGKVLTNIKQETYSDGSYTVPCALYCG